jgi:hypothetical protein
MYVRRLILTLCGLQLKCKEHNITLLRLALQIVRVKEL